MSDAEWVPALQSDLGRRLQDRAAQERVLAVQKACDDVINDANDTAVPSLREAVHAAHGIRVEATDPVGTSICTAARELIKAAHSRMESRDTHIATLGLLLEMLQSSAADW